MNTFTNNTQSLLSTKPTSTTKTKQLGYKNPTPSRWLISALGLVNRKLMLHGFNMLKPVHALLQKAKPLKQSKLNKVISTLAYGVLKVKRIDLPESDLAILQKASDNNSATFFAPNHPEFFTDWMIDKEISMRTDKYTAFWANEGIVNASKLSQAFWLRNNLIANSQGAGGKQHSIAVARDNGSVLLHPEGHVSWCGKHVAALFPGVVDMAIDTVIADKIHGTERTVNIAPFVSHHMFTTNVHDALLNEVQEIATALNLAVPATYTLGRAFARLHLAILDAEAENFGYVFSESQHSYWSRKAALSLYLETQLGHEFGEQDDCGAKKLRTFKKLNAAWHRRTNITAFNKYKKIIAALERLTSFTEAHYCGSTLSQEEVAESLKNIKKHYVNRTQPEKMANMVPIPVAERVAYIRACEPISVDTLMKEANHDVKTVKEKLSVQLPQIIQGRLNQLIDGLSEFKDRYCIENLLN